MALWRAVAGAVLLAVQLALHVARTNALRRRLRQAEDEVELVAEARRSERAGRTKAERELRALQLRGGQLEAAAAGAAGAGDPLAGGAVDLRRVPFPLRPIGVLRSCFSRRNGTPRQPLLVPSARAELTLRAELSGDYLEGLGQYTHCWVLYVFHENTNLQRLWQGGGAGGGVPAKIRVPRLDGGRLGVFATRSPHRPCPIGLSVAQVLAVEGRTLVLGGADIVDGSPVLDVKPYVPFCDSVPTAGAPAWVAPRAEDEPLDIGSIAVGAAAEAALRACWAARGARSLYRDSYEAYRGLLLEVLSRDIRSVTQRVKVPAREAAGCRAMNLQEGPAPPAAEAGEAAEEPAEGKWHVVLDGVDITYDVDDDRRVLLRGATLCAG